MKITVRIDAGLVRKIQELAVEKGTSVNNTLTGHIEQVVHERKCYEHARKSASARLSAGLDLEGLSESSRDELHER